MNLRSTMAGVAWPHGLKQRLAVTLGLAAFIATGILSLLGSHSVRHQVERDQGTLMHQLAHDLAAQLSQDLAGRAALLRFAAAQSPLRETATPASARSAFLADIAKTHSSFAWMGVADTEGRIVASTEPTLLGKSVAGRDWFEGGRKGLHFGDAHEAKLLAAVLPKPEQEGMPLRLVDIALPVFDGEGRAIGVLAAHLNLEWAFKLRKRMLERIGDDAIDVAVIRKDGEVLIGRGSLARAGGGTVEPVTSRREGPDAPARVLVWADDGLHYLTASAPVAASAPFPGLGWTVYARKPEERAFAGASALSLQLVLWGALVCAVFLACLWLILDRETRALRRLGAAAARIANQDLDTPIPAPEGRGEVAVFTRSLVSLVGALQHSRAGYRHLFEDAPVALCHADTQGRVIEINRRFVQTLGYDRVELPSLEALWRLACHDAADRARLLALTEMPSRAATDIDAGEVLLRHRNGEERTVQVTAMVDVDGIVIALQDVSRERRAESELRLWGQAFDQTQTGLILVNARSNRVIAVNPAFAAQRGYREGELVDRPVLDLFPADRHEQVRAIVRSDPADLHGVFESEHQRRDGSRFPVLIDLTRITDERGEPVARLGIVHDISERRRVEAELARTQAAALAAEHRARLATLNQMQDATAARARAEVALAALRISQAQVHLFIEHAPAALAMFDRRMRYLEVSRRWREALDLGDRTLIGECHYDVFPGISEDWKAVHARGLAGEVVRRDSDVYPRPDGSVLWMRWEVRPWRDEQGAVGGIVIFFEDISRQKAAEDEIRALNEELEARVETRTAELTAANRELDSFAHAVTHDLRAPLRAMRGYARILEEDHGTALPEDARALLRQIQQSGVRMGDLIDAIAALSHVGGSKIERQVVDLSTMAQQLFETIAETDPAHRPAWNVEPGIVVEGDRRMLESVMQNLIANAWKYTGKCARPAIRVHTEARDEGRWVCVTDNGAGFSMARAGRLFEPFQRLHRQEEFPGIGIGLATVQRIIRRHGGEITAHGEPGRGATFRFWLPTTINPARPRTIRTSILTA